MPCAGESCAHGAPRRGAMPGRGHAGQVGLSIDMSLFYSAMGPAGGTTMLSSSRVAVLMVCACLWAAPPSRGATFQEWSTTTQRHEMDGTSNYYATTTSQNTLNGWLQDGRILLGYDCQDRDLYIRANGLGFHTDDIYTGSGRLERFQAVRVKIDDGATEHEEFQVWPDNNDGMTLRGSSVETRSLLSKMKQGILMRVEVTLFNTKGREQVARFSLMGFTAATQWCKEKTD